MLLAREVTRRTGWEARMVASRSHVAGGSASVRHHCWKAAGVIIVASWKGQIPQSLDYKDGSLHDGESELWVPIYEARLNHEYRKSIPYFEEKDNPVKHILALCSILWQGNHTDYPKVWPFPTESLANKSRAERKQRRTVQWFDGQFKFCVYCDDRFFIIAYTWKSIFRAVRVIWDTMLSGLNSSWVYNR